MAAAPVPDLTGGAGAADPCSAYRGRLASRSGVTYGLSLVYSWSTACAYWAALIGADVLPSR